MEIKIIIIVTLNMIFFTFIATIKVKRATAMACNVSVLTQTVMIEW